jgi:hypothetical protein
MTAVLAALTSIAVACGDDDPSELDAALDDCIGKSIEWTLATADRAELEEQVRVVARKAWNLGATQGQLRIACGDDVLEQLDLPARSEDLLVEADVSRCAPDSLEGRVQNSSDDTVDVTLYYELLSSDDVRLGQGSIEVVRVKPGQTAAFKEALSGASFDSCTIEIDDVRPAAFPATETTGE